MRNTDEHGLEEDEHGWQEFASRSIITHPCHSLLSVFITFKLAMLKLTQYVLETRTETAKFD